MTKKQYTYQYIDKQDALVVLMHPGCSCHIENDIES